MDLTSSLCLIRLSTCVYVVCVCESVCVYMYLYIYVYILCIILYSIRSAKVKISAS